MTASTSIDLTDFLDQQLAQASPDLLREMLKAFAQTLMSADAEAACGAGYNQRSQERTNSRNGYRERRWDTRAGSIDLAIPKLRSGTYFPEWLLERRKRAEAALVRMAPVRIANIDRATQVWPTIAKTARAASADGSLRIFLVEFCPRLSPVRARLNKARATRVRIAGG